jgi:hypothetical protein
MAKIGMNEQSESPFFPVPVRWFELPMNTVRWGFMRMDELAKATAAPTRDERAEPESDASFEQEPAPDSHVGTLLNERA